MGSRCPSLSTVKVASMDDAIEVRAPEEFKDANKFSSICKFTLFNTTAMASVFAKELFFFSFFFKALLLATDNFINIFSLWT